jgi:hypothetical protein
MSNTSQIANSKYAPFSRWVRTVPSATTTVVLLRRTCDRFPDELVILDLPVERFFAADAKHTRDDPHNVLVQAVQDHFVIGSAETFHVRVDRASVRRHIWAANGTQAHRLGAAGAI